MIAFGSDRALRARLFTRESFTHPAKLHLLFLRWLGERYTAPGQTVIDPMYGVGSTGYLALLQRNVIGFEVEPRWLAHAHHNAARITLAAGMFAGRITVAQHDAREPWPFLGALGDVVLFSPPYGCDAKRNPERRGQVLTDRLLRIGRERIHYSIRWEQLAQASQQYGANALFNFAYGEHPAQIGHLRGAAYWEAMVQIYRQAAHALPAGGLLILVLKDHIRNRCRVRVCDETATRVASLGFRLVERHVRRLDQLSLWQRRRREAGDLVVEEEEALVFVKEPM